MTPPPTILNPLPKAAYQTDRERRAGFGGGVSFHCVTSADQLLSRIWYYNGEMLRSGIKDRIIHKNGTLTIQFLTVSHFGIYQCIISNKFGDDMRTWFLEIRQEGKLVLQEYFLVGS